jgi:glycerate 2-kinase
LQGWRDARKTITTLADAALTAVDGRRAVRRALEEETSGVRLSVRQLREWRVERILMIAVGKAAVAMASGARQVLEDRIIASTITAPRGSERHPDGADLWEAAHPVPDAYGMVGAAEALNLARGAGPRDLVLCLLSGGASALWAAPPRGLTLTDIRRTTESLLRCGAPIQELNAVRKHLSRIAGGQLARAASPARIVTLLISDVVDSPLDVIGSGPTVADPTTFADALGVIRARGVEIPAPAVAYLQAGAAGEVAETPKPGDPVFQHAASSIVARNLDALRAAAREAERLGMSPRIVSDRLEGEARDAAATIMTEVRRARQGHAAGEPPLALLWGGETTVTVRGDGRGGRNQELALATAILLAGEDGVVIACLGTDGVDGPTDAAGAIIDGGTAGRAAAAGLDPVGHLRRNDAYPLLQATGDLIVTGPTGTNVNDLVIALIL